MKKNKDDKPQITIAPSLRFELSEIEQARQDAAADQARADETRPVIESAITFLAAVQGENRLTKEKLAPRISQAQDLLTSHRSHEIAAVRRDVLMALLSFRLTTPVDSQEQATGQMSSLVKDGLLKEASEGTIAVYGKNYFPADPVLEEPEIEQIREFTKAMVSNVRRALHDKASLRPSDLGDPTKEGICVLFVPPQKAGENKFRPGGLLTIAQTRGPRGTVTPLDGEYKIEGPISRAQALGVSLDFNQLNAQKPPFLKDVPEDVGKATQVFWHLINRGRDFAAWIEAARKHKGLLTEEEFLLEGKIGVCVLDYGRAWEVRTDGDSAPTWWLSRPVVIMERSKNGTGNVLAIKDLPSYLSDFFDKCRGTFPERGQRFEGVPQPLQAFLRAMYGKALEVSEKRQAAAAS